MKEEPNMRRLTLITGFFLMLLLLAHFYPAPSNANDKVDPKIIFEQRCSKCHKLDRSKPIESPEIWKTIVDRMAKKRNSEISASEAILITKYLQENMVKK